MRRIDTIDWQSLPPRRSHRGGITPRHAREIAPMTIGRRALAALSLAALPLATISAFTTAARAQTAGPSVRPLNTPGEGAVNTWLLIGADGVTIVDCQRTVPEAEALVAAVRGLGRRVEAIVLTHEHPDHAAGLQAVLRGFPGTPIIATAATARALEASKAEMLPLMARIFGPAAPTDVPSPTRIVADGERLTLGGRAWRIDEHGPGEAQSMTTLWSEEAGLLVASDLVGNRVTPYLLEGRTGQWLAQLERVRARYPARSVALPGHGTPAAIGLLAEDQAAYLGTFRGLVQGRLRAGAWTEAARAAVAAEAEATWPGWPVVVPIPGLIAQNADAVARELAQ
jgi:glyoxylase-like metal-dependent hydrolase (beta-lactamase superfamily II)